MSLNLEVAVQSIHVNSVCKKAPHVSHPLPLPLPPPPMDNGALRLWFKGSLYFTVFLFLALDSNILKTNSSYLYHLGTFLEPAVGYNSHWLLCWRATLHGWNVRTQFHRRCDGKRDTVTIIKNGKYVFGGYTDIPWGKNIACSV